jgi:uncharacterized membrane protein SpoIIM required for sporulation/cell division protein ZapA (FtsZ GTPase activity inhibitor)
MSPRDRIRIQTLTARISQRLQEMQGVKMAAGATTGQVDAAFNVIHDYELLAREIYRLRAREAAGREPDPLISRTEDFLSGLAQDLVQLTRKRGRASPYADFMRGYRRIWRENLSLFIFTAAIFVGSLFLGWNIGHYQQDYVPLIVGQAMMETVLDQTPWFERLSDDPVMGMLGIAYNNMRVTLLIFALGSLCGLGGLGLLIYNGIMIGALMGYCTAHDFDDRLMEFVLSHGFLELTIVVAGAFSSFLIGRSFYLRPFSKMGQHVAVGAKEGFTVAMGIVPWLVLAAVFEAFVSPSPLFDFKTKLFSGLVIGILFWVWTFHPADRSDQA